MRELVFFNPVLKETIWGGTRLEEYHYELPGDCVGECWAVSAHPNGDAVVKDGRYQGKTLSYLWEHHNELFGEAKGEVFPLLTKIIDAREDLSIQVHPDDDYAMINEGGALGKTECWYILDCDENATIVIGHHGENKASVSAMIDQGRWSEFIREIPIKPGDFFMIEPGTVHAIKGGTLLLETQQNSDITYRVYDYDREDKDGNKRELHVRQSKEVIVSPYINRAPEVDESATVNENMTNLVSCPHFHVWKMQVNGTQTITQDQSFMIVSVIHGAGSIDGRALRKGDHFIIPYEYGNCELSGDMNLIISGI